MSLNPRTERFTLPGPAGLIEVARDRPEGAACGTAIVAHPHPLFGGTLDNKVVQTLARAFVQCGWATLRFNFRGVGLSEGAHDGGQGECEDLLSLVAALAPEGPLALAGFSFGAFVASHAIAALAPRRAIEQVVLVGTAASRFTVAPLPEALRPLALVVHGEQDTTVPLASVMGWARPQTLPVTVIPGGEHFFHGQLPLLKQLVVRHLRP